MGAVHRQLTGFLLSAALGFSGSRTHSLVDAAKAGVSAQASNERRL